VSVMRTVLYEKLKKKKPASYETVTHIDMSIVASNFIKYQKVYKPAPMHYVI